MERIAVKKDKEDATLKDDEIEKVELKDLKSLSCAFWLIAANCTLTYLGIFPFNNISNQIFRDQYNFTQNRAAQLTLITYLMSAFLAPCFGFLCDKLGHRITFCIGSAVILTGSHVLFIILGSCD